MPVAVSRRPFLLGCVVDLCAVVVLVSWTPGYWWLVVILEGATCRLSLIKLVVFVELLPCLVIAKPSDLEKWRVTMCNNG